MKKFRMRQDSSTVLIALVALVCFIVLGVSYYSDAQSQEVKRFELVALKASIDTEATPTPVTTIGVKEDKLEVIPGFVCWGDSLTAGAGGEGISYPTVLCELMAKDGYPYAAVNMGVGGENTKAIMARSGALKILLSAPVTIPAATDPVEIRFAASDGSSIALLRQGNAGMKIVSIDGILGTITIKQDSITSSDFTYFFTRQTVGDSMWVDSGTQIINNGSYQYADYIPIIFMGQNGGWSNNPDILIEQQQSILNANSLDRDKFLIVGLTSGTLSDRKDLESVMQEHWGIHYINMRKYLCDEEFLRSKGIVLNTEDRNMISKGIVPACIRVDRNNVHFNKKGYTIIAEVIYERLAELKYL
jgi:lysophospholipase L1-like esterase